MIELRPHHFLCTLGFEGKGYSDEFVQGYTAIAAQLRAPDGSGDAILLKVAAATDSVCTPCPNRHGSRCASEDKIQELDRGHASVLGIQAGQKLTWGEAKHLIATKMSDEHFERVCAPCSWKSLGVCKVALHRNRKELKP